TVVVALTVGHRVHDIFILPVATGEQCLIVDDFRRFDARDESVLVFEDERTRQQPDFGQYLETVAYAENRLSRIRRFFDRFCNWGVRRHCSAAELVAVGKTAGNQYTVISVERCRSVVYKFCLSARFQNGIQQVTVTVAAWKLYYSEFLHSDTSSIIVFSYVSITVLVNRRSDKDLTILSMLSAPVSSMSKFRIFPTRMLLISSCPSSCTARFSASPCVSSTCCCNVTLSSRSEEHTSELESRF